ncbi:MAG: GAF domain-containing protein [Burkholderiaceae bacterium]
MKTNRSDDAGAATTADQTVDALARLAGAVASLSSSDAIWTEADHVLNDVIGHRLFTVLAYSGDSSLVTRVYSNQPIAYPVSGTKAMGPTPWGQRLLVQGQPYIGHSADDIRWAFPDHELILSLGLESTLNLPLRHRGRVLGTLNLLDAADHYREAHLPAGLIAAALLGPVMQRWLSDAGMLTG